ncbi:hypothetical protein QT971_14920 [Microcoleus sp. herbarium19]|uniref:hypothetical protein n=1 Tax=unclassified Microcoleus TaxID=2642155 RepID=UPI002FD32F3C
MSQEFLPGDNLDDRPNDGSAAVPEQEVVRVTVTGSPSSVRESIHTLYRLGFAEVGDWSRPQRGAKSGEVVSVPIRRRQSKLTKVAAVKTGE